MAKLGISKLGNANVGSPELDAPDAGVMSIFRSVASAALVVVTWIVLSSNVCVWSWSWIVAIPTAVITKTSPAREYLVRNVTRFSNCPLESDDVGIDTA